MRYARSIAVLAFLTAALFLLTGCDALTDSDDGGDGVEGTVFLWVGADKDAYVSSSMPNRNYGTNSGLVVAQQGDLLKQTYVHFSLPLLPSGSTVEEAYFELYHSGQNEDGQTDDVNIPVTRAAGPWSPGTLLYGSQPNEARGGLGYRIHLNSKDWSGTRNIADIVRGWYDDPSSNHGFHVYWDKRNPGIEKGFYSNNHRSRAADDLGRAPRLLLKVQLPEGTDSGDIQLPSIPGDNDLEFDGREILIVRFSGGSGSGSDWPAGWNVRRGF